MMAFIVSRGIQSECQPGPAGHSGNFTNVLHLDLSSLILLVFL